MSKNALSGRVTPSAFRVWQEIHEHGPLTASQAHERIGGPKKERTRGLVNDLLFVGAIEECGTVSTRGARARQYRTVKPPIVRVPEIQSSILAALADGPLPFDRLQRALAARPNAQKLGCTLKRMRTAGAIDEVIEARTVVYRLAAKGEQPEPKRRKTAPRRRGDDKRGPVFGPSGRRLIEREEWIDG
jgi:hypothetical protein